MPEWGSWPRKEKSQNSMTSAVADPTMHRGAPGQLIGLDGGIEASWAGNGRGHCRQKEEQVQTGTARGSLECPRSTEISSVAAAKAIGRCPWPRSLARKDLLLQAPGELLQTSLDFSPRAPAAPSCAFPPSFRTDRTHSPGAFDILRKFSRQWVCGCWKDILSSLHT